MARANVAIGLMMIAVSALARAETDPGDMSAAFRAAGYSLKGNEWHKCDDPGTASYSPGELQLVGDLNGDGRGEAVITESSAYCYGMAGTAFSLVSEQADGWKLVAESVGMPNFLPAKGAGGWPDIEVGGPGFCFPVLRWNGREYSINRYQYEGKACRP